MAKQASEEGGTSGKEEKPVQLEKEVASIMETMSHTTILVGLVLFGLLVDFVAELVNIVGRGAGFSAFQILTAIGTYLIIAVLFISAFARKRENAQFRLGMLLAAAIMFLTLPFIIG